MIDKQQTILLVEDDAIIALNQKSQLTKRNYNIIHAGSGEKAIDLFKISKELIDLILMDIDLGKGIDGTQAASEILKIKTLPIVFLSSHTEQEIVEKVESITSYGYVVKNSGITVLDASIKMAFKLFDAHKNILQHKTDAEITTEILQKSVDNLSFLSTISQEQAETHNLDKLIQLIIKQLQNLTNAVFVTFSEYVSKEKLLKNMKIYADQAIINLGIKIVGKKILDTEVPVNDAYFKDITTERIKVFPSLYEDTNGAVNLKVSTALHKTLKLGNIWGLSYAIDNELFGGSVFALKKDQQAPDKKVLESFINISSISIRRLILEQKLRYRVEKLNNINDINMQLSTKENKIHIMQDMLDNYEEAIWTVDKDLKITFLNSYFSKDYKKAFGREIKIGLGTFSKFRSKAEKVWRPKYELALKGERVSFEYKENAHRGIRYFQVNLNPIHINNKITGVSAISVDITRQKLTELKVLEEISKSQQYLDIAGVMFVAINIDSNITLVNKKLCRTTGYTEKELIGENWFKKMIPERLQAEIIPVSEKLFSGKIEPVEYFENPILTKDGQEIIIAWHNTILKDGNGNITGHLSSGNDITSRIKSEEAIKILLKEKEIILTEVHHRIKNHMTTLISLIALQTNTVKGKEAENALLEIENRIRTMMVLYETLYQSTDVQHASTKKYLSSLIDNIIGNFTTSSTILVNKNISDFQLNAKRIFNLGIVINELITNIMKYAFKDRPSGQIDFSIICEKNIMVISVADNGIGLPSDIDLNNNPGFGMKLIKMLVEQMDGDIQIERKNGTKFIINCKLEDS